MCKWKARAERCANASAPSAVPPRHGVRVRKTIVKKTQGRQNKIQIPCEPCCASTPAPGPANFEEAMGDWALANLNALRLLDPESHCRLRQVLARGIDVTTHYSGTGTAEAAIATVAARIADSHAMPACIAAVSCYSACDISPVCQEVLENHPVASRPLHRFSDLCARPPAELVQRLRERLPGFQKKAGLRASTPGGSKKHNWDRAASKHWVSFAMNLLSEWMPSRSSLAHCLRHGHLCATYPPRTGRYHLEVSGVNCQPWSQAGQCWGWLDDRSIPCLILVRIILAVEPDGVCIECTPRFDFQTLRALLQPSYTGDFAITSPADFGLPIDRGRLYMWFDRRSAVSSATRPMSDIRETCRTQQLSLDVFLRASPEEVQRYYRKLLGSLRSGSPVLRRRALVGKVCLEDVLCAGNWTRYRRYRELIASLPDAPCYVVDVHKTPEYGAKPRSRRMPTLLRSSVLVVLCRPPAEDRLLLPTELPALHGLEIAPGLLSRLPAADVRSLVGNSMHMVQVGVFVQFALGTRVLR